MLFFFFKQKTAYEMRISDWSSDVCSSDLRERGGDRGAQGLQRSIRAEPAVRARLNEDVPERGGLDGPRENGQPRAVGGGLAQQLVERAATDDVDDVDVAVGQTGSRAHGGGEGSSDALDGDAREPRTAPTGRAPGRGRVGKSGENP